MSEAYVIEDQLGAVSAAFTKQSEIYDVLDKANPTLQWMRKQVRTHILNLVTSGSRILELNAGTGLDALYFASKGYSVYATDISAGMVREINGKIRRYHLNDMIIAEQRSYYDLNALNASGFNLVFSNFGGLNCAGNLEPVINELPRLLKPGGYVCFVLMPKIVPWELIAALKGNFKLAFRRFRKKAFNSQVEGIAFKTTYYSPRKAVNQFGKKFRLVKLQGLGSIAPPPHHTRLPAKHPLLFRQFTQWDEKLSNYWPFNRWADHYILTMQYLGEEIKN